MSRFTHSSLALVLALAVVLAGCGGLATQETTEPSQTTATVSDQPETTVTATQTTQEETDTPQQRGGLMTVSVATGDEVGQPLIEYDASAFGSVPVLNESITEVSRSNESATRDLSPTDLNSVEEFLESQYNVTRSEFFVQRSDVVVRVSIAREA